MNRPEPARAAALPAIGLARPPIVLGRSDYGALEKAAISALLRAPRVAGALLEEVDRAGVVADADLPHDAVRLGSWVEFTDSLAGAPRRVRLVERPPARLSPDELSVLTTEGAALVGLREGQTIVWPDRIGTDRVLTVVTVRNDLVLPGRPARRRP